VPLGPDSNWRAAARTWSSTTAVHGMPLPGDWRHQVAPHQVPRRRVKLAKPLIIQRGRLHPWIQAKRPERFALIDVADAGADPLLEEQLPQRGCTRVAGTAHDLIEVEGIDQDVRSQVCHWLSGVANQLHDGRGEADRHDIVETQNGGGTPLRLAPALAQPVEVPGAGHPHVRMQREPSLELHDQMFPVRFDRLDPPAFQSSDRCRTGVSDDLARDLAPQGGRRSPDRVAFRQGRVAARARGRRPSASCRTRLRAANLRVANP